MLVNKNVTLRVEMKNDLEISGVLTYVDANLNLQLSNISVSEPEKHPQLVSHPSLIMFTGICSRSL